MPAIPPELTHRLYETLLRCGPFDSDHTLRTLFVDARLSAWRDLLPEASSRVERARTIVDALSERENPDGDNALVLLLRVIAENTPPGDACQGQLAALAGEVAAVLRADVLRTGASSGDALPTQPPTGPIIFNQQGQQVGTQINVAGNYYPGKERARDD